MPLTALVVEDDAMMADLLREALKQMGYDAHVLHEGTHAAEWVRKHRPDLVLLDLMLPGRSGFEVCEELKLDRETNLTPIVVVTALVGHENMAQGLRVGANVYLTKPFTIDQLSEAIDRAFAQRRELERAGAHGEVHFQLKSDTHYLEELNRMVSSLLLYTGLSENDASHLMMAVREMGGNAIEWGNLNQAEQPVTVTYRIDSEKVVIVIRDNGSGFDRANLPHAAKSEDVAAHLSVREEKGLRTGGFGIFITRELVDDLTYNDAGNEVTLIKRFPRRPTEQPANAP